MYEPKEGEYYFRRHRNKWGVWKRSAAGKDGIHIDDFISDFSTQIQAANFVKKMNKWQ